MPFLLHLCNIGRILKTAVTEYISPLVDFMFIVPPSEISSISFYPEGWVSSCTPITSRQEYHLFRTIFVVIP